MSVDLNYIAITIISYFIVPFISLWIFQKRNPNKCEKILQIMSWYAVFCVLNITLTKIVGVVIERITAFPFFSGSIKYSIFAFVSALILPFLIEVCVKFISVEVEIVTQKRGAKNGEKDDK